MLRAWHCCILILASTLCAAEACPEPPIAQESLTHAADYTFGYYPHGWRRKKEDAPIHFAVQSNRYALLFNASSGQVARFGPLLQALPDIEAAAQDNALIGSLPEASLTFAAVWNGTEFPIVSGAGAPDQMRLYRVGKYLQHFDIQTARIGGVGSGAGLEGINAWIEGYCWSDRFSFLLHAAAHDSHLAPFQALDHFALAARLAIPPAYPIVEFLEGDGAWRAAQPGGATARAALLRNEDGAGMAVLCAPGKQQHIRFTDDQHLLVETTPMTLSLGTTADFPCVVVPSADVRAEAARQFSAMEQPLQVEAEGIAPYTGPQPVQPDAARGWHEIRLGENRDLQTMERVRVRLSNPGAQAATARLNFAKIGGGFPITGMSAVLRDLDGFPIGLPVQLSKNWHCAPPWFSGLAMLEVPPGRTLEFEFDLAYAQWGGVPAVSHAQLCLLGYGGNQLWDEMAIGSFGESITYDPDVNLGRSLIDDMRPLMVWGMGKEPNIKWSWTHNVGGCDFLTLMHGKKRDYLTRQKTLYRAYGPVLSDVTYAGETAGGAIQSRIRTQSWRSDDYVRALYTLRYDVIRPIEELDRLAFFQLGADRYNIPFQHIARGSATGLDELWDAAGLAEGYSRRGQPLPGVMPWIGLYGLDLEQLESLGEPRLGARGDKAMIVRSWKARLDGLAAPLPSYSVFATVEMAYRGRPGFPDGRHDAQVELALPEGVQHLRAGDFVEAAVEVLILPQRPEDYYGPNTGLLEAMKANTACWALTHREAARSQMSVEAKTGSVEQAWPLRIRAENGNQAEFVITGGVGYTPVTVAGASGYRDFALQRVKEDGTIEPINQSSAAGNDWWQALYLPDRKEWEITYTLPLDSWGGTSTFRWSAK